MSALPHRVNGLAEELNLVKSWMRGEGFVIMDHAFLSMMYVETYFRKGHFEYIIDAVSLFSFMSGIKYKSSNDDLDEKSKVKRLGLTSAQGKVLGSLHNVLPENFVPLETTLRFQYRT